MHFTVVAMHASNAQRGRPEHCVGVDQNLNATRPVDRRTHRWLAVLCLMPVTAFAQSAFSPFAAVSVEHDSNVFGFADREEAERIAGDPALSDTIRRAIVGADLQHTFGQQTLRVGVQGGRNDFQRFGQLDHTHHRVSAALDWRLGPRVDGLLDWRRERRMAALAERDSDALAMENERVATAALNLDIGADWRLENTVLSRELASPLVGLPRFTLQEDSFSTELRHSGRGLFNVGVRAEYLDGRFTGTFLGEEPFDQITVEAVANYAASGLSQLNARLGHSRRRDRRNAGNDTSAVTGLVSVERTISGITSVDLALFRQINSFSYGPESVIESGVRSSLRWQPTPKTGLQAGLEWSRNSFQDGPQNDQTGAPARIDRQRTAFVRVQYAPLPWLGLHPYVLASDRSSNDRAQRYDKYVVGLEVRIRFGRALPTEAINRRY
ncbi:hypothetical protein [Luteimonas terrae]|uniref:DUF560 domain-containing protein n=1 Tax=Luteimonas terrae TaxID=1530191 RepID=A0ABU1XY82_9GAMM|nr:hypothetical protein [Luteimonas terrae]MDR7193737.1 hypothetical protein [Luteimonas terrae]